MIKYTQAFSATGIVWLKGVNFKQGTIEVDLRGKDVFLQSFLGIAFHGVDTLAYDVVYFRPFNFRHPDTLRRNWSVQYMSMPNHGWPQLRKDSPLTYEHKVHPVPRAEDWFSLPTRNHPNDRQRFLLTMRLPRP